MLQLEALVHHATAFIATTMTFMLANVAGRYRPLIIALSIAALACAACSDATPTKDQILSRANDALAAEQYAKAEKDYREVLRLVPNDPVALRQLGIIYLDQGQVLQAYPLLKQSRGTAAGRSGAATQARPGLSRAWSVERRPRDRAQQVLDKKPGDETALLLLVDTAVTPDEIKETQRLIESLRETGSGPRQLSPGVGHARSAAKGRGARGERIQSGA